MYWLYLYVFTSADSTNVLNSLDSLHLQERTIRANARLSETFGTMPHPLATTPPSDSLYIINYGVDNTYIHLGYISIGEKAPKAPSTQRVHRGRGHDDRGVAMEVSGTSGRGRYLTDFYYLCSANETTEEAGSFLRSLYSIAIEQTKVKEEDCQ